MEVYDRAVRTVPSAQRLAVYNLYLARASEFFGIAKVREVYETAIEAQGDSQLSDVDCKLLCMRCACSSEGCCNYIIFRGRPLKSAQVRRAGEERGRNRPRARHLCARL